MDSKLIRVFSYLRGVYINRGNWEQAIDGLEQQLEFFREKDDKAGLVYTLGFLKGTFGLMGDWKKALDAMARGLEILNMVPEGHRLKIGLLEHAFWVSLWSGRYSEAEHEAREGLDLFQRPEAGDVDSQASSLRDLGLASGMQGKYDKAYSAFTQSTKKRQEIGQEDRRNTKGFWGASLLKQGKLEEAKKYLIESLSIKQNLQDNLGIPELLNWLGELHELRHDWPQAESYYSQSLELRGLGRRYFECGALTGLVRVRYAQGEYTIIPQLVTEAERLAQQYEYNDYLTSLRLIQGHIAWDGHTPEWGGGFDTALCHYQHALNYALRYNRFLLDEVLSGRPQGTPLLPVVPYCLERGEEGRRMLTALRDWWCTGLNDIGTPRPDTISPIPEGIPLIEAEQIARKREFGDGVRQRAVVDQINAGLGLGDGR